MKIIQYEVMNNTLLLEQKKKSVEAPAETICLLYYHIFLLGNKGSNKNG